MARSIETTGILLSHHLGGVMIIMRNTTVNTQTLIFPVTMQALNSLVTIQTINLSQRGTHYIQELLSMDTQHRDLEALAMKEGVEATDGGRKGGYLI